MKLITILLLFALVFALCLPSFALTSEQVVQAVKDFENDQNLQCYYGQPWQMSCGLHSQRDAHSLRVKVTAGNNDYFRRYKVTDSAVVASAILPDMDPDVNPSAALQQPLTEAQALAVAEDFAERVFSDYASCTWNCRDVEDSTSVHTYFIAQEASNGAITDRALRATVSLESGEVMRWSALDYSLPGAASATPSVTVSQAIDAVADEYTGLDGVTPYTQQLRYFQDVGLVYQLSYQFDPSQKPAGTPPLVYVAATDGELLSADFFLGAAPPTTSPAAQAVSKLLTDAFLAVIKAVASLF